MGAPQHTDLTIEGVDRAIRDWFDKTVDARVLHADGSLRKVPINFSQGERWSIGRTIGTFRDANGVLILPIIGLRRTGIDPDNTRMALGTQVPSIQVTRLVDPKSNDLKNLEAAKPHAVQRNYPPVYDIYTIPFPNSVVINYQLVVQAQYISQMNEILQKFWHELDLQKSFVAPLQNLGRHPPRAGQYGEPDPYSPPKPLDFPYVVGFLESNESAGDNFEEFTDQERVVKYATEVRVPCVLQTTPEGEQPSVRVQRTAYKFVFKDENFTFVDDPAELDKIFGKRR